MSTVKKSISYIVTIALFFSVLVPVMAVNTEKSVAETAPTKFSRNIEKMRQKFPDGKYWNHPVNSYDETGDRLQVLKDEHFADEVHDQPCAVHGKNGFIGGYDCNYFDGGLQCLGFAHKIFYEVFGERASGRYLSVAAVGRSDIRAGDVVRIGEFGNDGHSAFVLSRNGDTLTVVECNNRHHGGNCNIKWDSQMNVNSVTYYCRATNYDEMMKPIDISISEATVTVPNVTYTGKKLTPEPVVTYEGQALVKGTDYKCKYKNNKNIGLATVTITGIGNCKGSIKANFKIIPKGVSISKISPAETTILVTWKPIKSKPAVTGYQIGYSESSDMSNKKIITVKGSTQASKIINKLKSYTTYYVQIRTYKKTDGKYYRSGWSAKKKTATKKPVFSFNSYGRKISSKKLRNSFDGIEGAWLSVGSDSITIHLFDTKKGASGGKYGADKYWDLKYNSSDSRRGEWEYENKSKKSFWFSNFIHSSTYYYFSEFKRKDSKNFTVLKTEGSTWYAISDNAFDKFWKYKVSDWKNKKNQEAISKLPFQ